MKYAMLRQQPLLRVQVAASLKKKTTPFFFFFERKKYKAFTLWKNKHKDKGGEKNAISKLKDGYVGKINT